MPTVTIRGRTYDYQVEEYTDGYIGICTQFPEIQVFGKNKAEIKREITTAIEGYLEVFPQKLELIV